MFDPLRHWPQLQLGQEPRAQGRGQGQRNQQRHENGKDDGKAVVVEEPPDDAIHEGDRNEDRDDGPGAGHDRDAHLRSALGGGLEGRHALLEFPVHAFEDHDGVIDEKSDRHGERHQGQVVQGEIRQVEGEEGRDERGRHGDSHDDGGTEIQQERHRDDDNQEDAEHDVEADILD